MGDHEPRYKIFNNHGYNSENNKKLNVGQKGPFLHFSGPPVPPRTEIYAVRGDRSPGFSSPDFRHIVLPNANNRIAVLATAVKLHPGRDGVVRAVYELTSGGLRT